LVGAGLVAVGFWGKLLVAPGEGAAGPHLGLLFPCSCAMDWSLHFEMPIYLPPPERGELRTLLDAAHYMLALPRHTFGKPAWQEAAKAVVGAARGEVSFEVAWFAICRALLLERLP
jgi:hypothetical protein